MARICESLFSKLFIHDGGLVKNAQIDAIDASLLNLTDKRTECEQKLIQLKHSLTLLNDKTNKISNGQPRKQLVAQAKKRMAFLLKNNTRIVNYINYLETLKENIEETRMTSSMANELKTLRCSLIQVGAINIDDMKDDLDAIGDMNEDMKEVNFTLHDTMQGAWDADIGDGEDLLADYLADSDSEEIENTTTKIEQTQPVDQMETVDGDILEDYRFDQRETTPKEEHMERDSLNNLVHDF
jgi:hypothetical protein